MSEIIYIPNIENYNQEIVNGELVLTPKKFKKFSGSAVIIAREYYFLGKLSEYYEAEISELHENDTHREFVKRQVGMIHQIKITIRNRFAKKFEDKLWSELQEELMKECDPSY